MRQQRCEENDALESSFLHDLMMLQMNNKLKNAALDRQRLREKIYHLEKEINRMEKTVEEMHAQERQVKQSISPGKELQATKWLQKSHTHLSGKNSATQKVSNQCDPYIKLKTIEGEIDLRRTKSTATLYEDFKPNPRSWCSTSPMISFANDVKEMFIKFSQESKDDCLMLADRSELDFQMNETWDDHGNDALKSEIVRIGFQQKKTGAVAA